MYGTVLFVFLKRIKKPRKSEMSIKKTKLFNLKRLTEDQQDSLTSMLFPVHEKIFDGVTKEEFKRYVIQSPAHWSTITLFYGEQSEIVGYYASHIFQRGDIYVLRNESGLLKQYTGTNGITIVFIMDILRFKAQHPTAELYFLGMLVHPSSYHQYAKFSPVVYPNCNGPTPPKIQLLMNRLVDSFDVEPLSKDQPHLRKVGWITREETHSFKKQESVHAQFYKQMNPFYRQGIGLVTMVPMSMSIMAHGFIKQLRIQKKASITSRL